MILHDQHVHSSFSEDSNENIENYLKRACLDGQEYFITTEHVDIDLCDTGKDWDVDYNELLKVYEKNKNKYNIKTLLGIEAGYPYKKEDLTKLYNKIDSYDFDLINLSIHSYEDIDFYFIEEFNKYGIEETLNKYFKLMLEAVKEFRDFDVLSHIDYGFKTVYLNDNSLSIKKYEDVIVSIFNELIKRDKALEINTKVQEKINDDEHLRYILKLYKKCGGVNLTLSSDAHEINRYKSSFDRYLKIIKEEGFDHLNYFIKRKRYDYKI